MKIKSQRANFEPILSTFTLVVKLDNNLSGLEASEKVKERFKKLEIEVNTVCGRTFVQSNEALIMLHTYAPIDKIGAHLATWFSETGFPPYRAMCLLWYY